MRKFLSVMPIKASWMRLEWFLTPDSALDGDTPWKPSKRGGGRWFLNVQEVTAQSDGANGPYRPALLHAVVTIVSASLVLR